MNGGKSIEDGVLFKRTGGKEEMRRKRIGKRVLVEERLLKGGDVYRRGGAF